MIDTLAFLVFNMAHTLDSWRYLVAISTIPHIIAISILWSNTPESPKWLLTKGRITMCSILLKFIAEENGSEVQLLADGDIRAGITVLYDIRCPSALMSQSFVRVWIVCTLSLLVSLSFSVLVFLLMPSISADIPVSALLNKQASIPFLQPVAIATCLLLLSFVDNRRSIAGAYAFASCVSAAIFMGHFSTMVETVLDLLLLCLLLVALKQTIVLTVESFPTAFRCSCIGRSFCVSGLVTAGGYAAVQTEALLHSSTSYAAMCLLEMMMAVMIFLIPRDMWSSALEEWPEWSAESQEDSCQPAHVDGRGGLPGEAEDILGATRLENKT